MAVELRQLNVPVTQCLEVRFTWNAVTQFRPVPFALIREIWKARPMLARSRQNEAISKLLHQHFNRVTLDLQPATLWWPIKRKSTDEYEAAWPKSRCNLI
jgi:hypothetical protein